MPDDSVLAIDLGSSWCKAAYLDRHGVSLGDGRAVSPGIADQGDGTLDRFWETVVLAVRLADKHLGTHPSPVAIGISCQGLLGVCLDAEGRGMLPSSDIRSVRSSPHVVEAFSSPVWDPGGPYAYGYATRLAGLAAGLRETLPGAWRQIHRIGALHDYILYRLSGEWLTDPSTGPNQLEWPEGMMQLSGLPKSAFPTILEPWEVAGGLTQNAASALDLPCDTPVVVGLHDGAAANVGTGAVNPGDACLTLGTNFALRVVTGARPQADCFGYLVAPGQWAWVSSVPNVATQLDLVANALMDAPVELDVQHQRLSDAAAAVVTGEPLPALPSGETASLLTAVQSARSQGHTEGQVYLAILHLAASSLRELVQRAERDGAPVRRFVATGGGARNAQLLRLLATELGKPIEVGHPEAGLLGAGMVAAIGAGWYPTLSESWDGMGPASTHAALRGAPPETGRLRV